MPSSDARVPDAPLDLGRTGRLDEHYHRRVRRMVLLCSAIAGFGALGWAGFFGVRGDWLLVGLECTVASTSVAAAALARDGRQREASRLLVGMMYAVLGLFALVIDLPTPAAPRSSQHLMLAMGVVACLLMRDEPPWLRHGAPALYFVTWIVVGAGEVAIPNAHALPASVQVVGAWVNPILAGALIFLSLHVIQSDAAERSAIETDLLAAIPGGELMLHYQPQVADDGRVVGAEALLRWRHRTRGMVSPAEFIPVAERSGLMLGIGDWVLAEGCRQLAAWAGDPRTAELTLAINVSAVQFQQSDFVERVLSTMGAAGVDPHRLKLELTETMLARDIDDIVARMQSLKARGVGFSLDDFGTGFSSLSYLRRLPLDQLKIDRSFVGNMLDSSRDAAIARAVVDLGRSLDLHVIAEGVETDAQRRALRAVGCRTYQGFLFARPMEAGQFVAFVRARADTVQVELEQVA
jgi:EAL domain-containing protein (putative c-di-GMP-specific phosphodiesterase class I)